MVSVYGLGVGVSGIWPGFSSQGAQRAQHGRGEMVKTFYYLKPAAAYIIRRFPYESDPGSVNDDNAGGVMQKERRWGALSTCKQSALFFCVPPLPPIVITQ